MEKLLFANNLNPSALQPITMLDYIFPWNVFQLILILRPKGLDNHSIDELESCKTIAINKQVYSASLGIADVIVVVVVVDCSQGTQAIRDNN